MTDAPPPEKEFVYPDIPMSSLRREGPFGKLDAEGKYKIDETTMAAFRQICAENDTDPSSEVRNYVYEVVHGKSYDEMVLEKQQLAVRQRRSLLAGVRGLFGAPSVPPIGPAARKAKR